MMNIKIDEFVANRTKEMELTEGELIVIRSYNNTKSNIKSDAIVIDEIVWDQESLLHALDKFNVNELIISDSSTALMKTLTSLLSNGFKLDSPIELKEDSIAVEDYYTIQGLMLKRL